METVVFDGPELELPMKHERYGLFVFPQGVPVQVPEDFAKELLELNPRKLPVTREPGYEGPLAVDYGMKCFRIVEDQVTPVPAAAPAAPADVLSLRVEGGDR